ncbi:MAG: aminopeptidase P N-terminal domain-containing protein, partial [Gillisia sp.]|nr:aminopeptidase P N-terminal domain-containing protein [Gillisia sp.]
MFSRDTYISRRKSLKSLVHQGIIFFPGNGESGMNYRDNTYPFRQDSTFLYYTGINNIPDICFVIDVDNDEEILFGDDLTPEDMVWTGAVEPLAEFAEKSGIARVKPLKGLPEFLRTRKKKGQRIHYLPPYRGDTSIQIGELLGLPIDKVE